MSLLELTIGMGLTAMVAYSLVDMDKNQQKAMKGMSFRMDAQVMTLGMQKIMSDENSCTAMLTASGSPPDMSQPISLTKINKTYFASGAWKTLTMYETAKLYGPVILSAITVRPFKAGDDIPGHKLELEYIRKGDGYGSEMLIKTLPFFFDDTPAEASPGINFSCSTTPETDVVHQLVHTPRLLLGCSPRMTEVPCPPGTKPLTCGVIDMKPTKDEDKVTCALNINGQACRFYHELSGNCDEIYGECYCM